MKIINTILVILSVLLVAWCILNNKGYLDGLFAGYKAGIQSQITENIKHGVMDANGKWFPKHELAR